MGRQGFEVYYGYLMGREEEIGQESPIILEIRDFVKKERKVVKALVSSSPGDLPEGKDLWVRDYGENFSSKPWRIKILEELDQDNVRPERRDIDIKIWEQKLKRRVEDRGGERYLNFEGDGGLPSGYFMGQPVVPPLPDKGS